MSPSVKARRSPGRIWAIGDIHGCYKSLLRLWEKIPFDESVDRLWLVGDLVNRGTGSPQVLRWAKERHDNLGNRFRAVLGNHDLHLLAVDRGISALRKGDTIQDVLEARDRAELVNWLQQLPLVHSEGSWILVHAGLKPKWTAKDARRKAERLSQHLLSPHAPHLLARRPRAALPKGFARLRRQLAVLTRMRMCHSNGSLAKYSGPPEEAPKGLTPWHELPGRQWTKRRIVCGHWAAQGLRLDQQMLALDSACVWGRKLSAVCLEDYELLQVKCRKNDVPARP